MDGNRRWAQQQTPRCDWQQGHRQGVKSLKKVISLCCEAGVQALTVYAFSAENWQRDRGEVAFLLLLLESSIRNALQELQDQEVRIVFAGERSNLPGPLLAVMNRAEAATAGNSRLVLCVALSYGGRQDLASAARRVAELVQQGRLRPEEVTEEVVEQQLSTWPVLQAAGPPDLLVRTSGEQRLSNFMLWESSYAELHFTPVHWPDFGREEFAAALAHYASRQRRFGRQ